MGFLSKTLKVAAGGTVLAGGLAFADQASGGHAYSVIDRYLQSNGYQGLSNIPFINDLANATKSLTNDISKTISSQTGLSAQYAGYTTTALGALAALGGAKVLGGGVSNSSFSLSNTWNSMGKNRAYSQAQSIADQAITRVKGPWYHRSKATDQTFQGAIQQDLNSIKSKAGTVATGLTRSLDPDERQSQIDDINSALTKLYEKGVISKYRKFSDGDFTNNSIMGQLSPEDQEILGEWTDSDFGNDIAEITGRKAVSAKKSGFIGKVVKFAAVAGMGLYADEVLLGGWTREKLTDGFSGLFNANSWNPFDLAVQVGRGFDPGLMKIGAGVAMFTGGMYAAQKVAKEFGGAWGITAMLGVGTALGLTGMNSDTNVNWSNKKESFLTGGENGFAEFAKEYFPDFSMRVGGP